MGSRLKGGNDRIGFGLQRSMREGVNFKVPRTLFKFGVQQDGFFNAGTSNVDGIAIYRKCKSCISASPVPTPSVNPIKLPRAWRPLDVAYLVDSRCQPNPPTYKNIAFSLNHRYASSFLPHSLLIPSSILPQSFLDPSSILPQSFLKPSSITPQVCWT